MKARATTIMTAALSLLGCDPCTGVIGCTTDPHLTINGQILDETSAQPARATIDFIRTSGVALDRDSVRVTTDDDGQFVFSIAAAELGQVNAEIVVRPSSGPGYRAIGRQFSTSDRRGEGTLLRAWSTVVHASDLIEVHRQGGVGELLADVAVEFQRTGGARLTQDVVFRTRTGSNGVAPMFGDEVAVLDAGDVIGNLTITVPNAQPNVVQGFRVLASPEFRYNAKIVRVGVGATP